MPSFLSDDNSHIYLQSSGIVHLDPANQYGLGHDKVNGHIPRHLQAHPSRESFEESSTHSTHTSETSDVRPQMNGDNSWPPSMSTLNNGGPSGGANAASIVSSNSRNWKELANGNTVTLVDRTVIASVPLASQTRKSESSISIPRDDELNRHATYLKSTTEDCGRQPPVERGIQSLSNTDVRTANSSSASGLSPVSLPMQASTMPLPTSSTPSLSPVTPSQMGNNQQSPQRFSSPPIYQPATATTSSSAASQQSAGPALKYRHTLEVPKGAPARVSRDGVDTAFTSGRFSPTAAGVAGTRRASVSLARRNTRSLHSEIPRDEIVPDEDALRWAEAYRAKRASKRKRREIEDDDKVLVGTKVDESHANWVTAYNMLTGIRVSVSRTNAKLDRDLTDADFEAKQKSTFDIAGNELVPSAKYDFKFKDYAPWVFRHLRARFRLDPADYLMSLTGKYILSELGSPGKSGSFFYFSRDYKYIIKTIHHAEHKFLRKILKDYYHHVTKNPNTLLSQFYGLHRVKMPYGKKIHFVVMNNLFPPHRDIHQTFDLKGSTIGRDYKEEELEKNPRATLKDLNWLRRKRHLELGIQKKQLFLEQLYKDVSLLQKLQIMDYSLLVGIHDMQKGNEENLRDKTLKVFNPGGDASDDFDPHSVLMRTPSKLENQRKARELRQMIRTERPGPVGETLPDELGEGHSRVGFIFNQDDGGFRATHEDNSPGEEIYYLGVIDCLTHYGMIKKMEHFWKGLSNDRTQISALPPQEYGDRFLNFISGITLSSEEATREASERDTMLMAEAAASEERERMASWGSTRRRSSNARIPPIPEYSPPPPPSVVAPSGQKSPESNATLRRAEHEEDKIPDRVLTTTTTDSQGRWESGSVGGQGVVLPVVEETPENTSAGDGVLTRGNHISSLGGESARPLTPAKDGTELVPGFGNPALGKHHSAVKGRGPPTPPKTGCGYGSSYPVTLKPESADSGYGVFADSGSSSNGLRSIHGSQKSIRVVSQVGRDSLDKALPPLPPEESVPTRVS